MGEDKKRYMSCVKIALWVQGRVGEEKLVQLCKEGKLDAGKLLAADPEFDPKDLPDPAAFLKSKGLGAIPLEAPA